MIDLYSEVTQRPRGSVEARMYALRDSGIVPKGQRGRGKQPEFGIKELVKLTFANVADEVRQADKEVQAIAEMRPVVVTWDASMVRSGMRALEYGGVADDYIKTFSRMTWSSSTIPALSTSALRWPDLGPLDCLEDVIVTEGARLESVSHEEMGQSRYVELTYSTYLLISEVPFLPTPESRAHDDLVMVLIKVLFGAQGDLDTGRDLHERKTSLAGDAIMLMADAVLEEGRET